MSLPGSQKGFTLIELVAIIVILGIFASIAVPKYYDLTLEAKNRAALQAVMEGKARLSMSYARLFLENAEPPSPSNLVDAVGVTTSIGDYVLTFSVEASSSDIQIQAQGKSGIEGASSALWLVPK